MERNLEKESNDLAVRLECEQRYWSGYDPALLESAVQTLRVSSERIKEQERKIETYRRETVIGVAKIVGTVAALVGITLAAIFGIKKPRDYQGCHIS